MQFAFEIDEILSFLPDTQVKGSFDGKITGIASLRDAKPGDLSFLSGPKYAKDVKGSGASAIIVPDSYEGEPAANQVLILHAKPSLALAMVCERIEWQLDPKPEPGIHPSAVVDPKAEIDPSATIGPLCVIEAGARVGAGVVLEAQVFLGREAVIGQKTRLRAHVVIYHGCVVGERCLLHAGCVIGADGFGFESTPQGHRKVPQIGIVRIANDVEIGANSCIDRARFSETRIGRGTKIDNLVQVGHNCVVGEHCFLCSGVGISGSTTVGNFVVLAGQVGLSGHIEIGDYCQIGGQAGVAKSIPPKTMATGSPAREFKEQRRLEAMVRRLPQLFDRVQELEQHLDGSDRDNASATDD